VEDNELDRTFAALADPTRRAILARLAEGEATVNMVARPFEMSLQAVSRHLKVLEGAGLITRRRDAQFRPCAFEEAPLEAAARWIQQNRETWRREADHAGPEAEKGPEESPFRADGDWAR
jgi:DNA-binding transcriptional ArsR family regulator